MLIGVDVGGTNLRIGVVEGLRVIAEQRVHADYSRLCRDNPPEIALPTIHASLIAALSDAIRKYPGVRGIGIGFPGFIDPSTGCISQSPNLPGLRDIDLVTPLRDSLGLLCVTCSCVRADQAGTVPGPVTAVGLRQRLQAGRQQVSGGAIVPQVKFGHAALQSEPVLAVEIHPRRFVFRRARRPLDEGLRLIQQRPRGAGVTG